MRVLFAYARPMGLWEVLPDGERDRWKLDPHESVGPVRFGMSRAEVSAAVSGMRRHQPRPVSCTYDLGGQPHDAGLTFFWSSVGKLRGVSADALRGPQVVADGKALTGQVPSELEQWILARAGGRPPGTELAYLPAAQAASLSLGVVLCLQRAGDRLATRPVFLPADAMDDIYHQLDSRAWTTF